MNIVEHLTELGGKVKDNRIYITAFWKELLKVKTSTQFRCGNQRLTSMTVAGRELLKYGDDPKANERTRRNALNFIKSMAYAYFDLEEGEFKGVKGADIVYVPEYNVVSIVFNGKFYDVRLSQ